jgi:hypothetical protein
MLIQDGISANQWVQGKYDEAEPLYWSVLKILEKSLGGNHPNIAAVLENLAALLRKTNREADAQEMEEREGDTGARKNEVITLTHLLKKGCYIQTLQSENNFRLHPLLRKQF